MSNKILGIEDKLGESLDFFLRREYVEKRRSSVEIGVELGIGHSTIVNWLHKYDIPTRNVSQIKLAPCVVKPTREQLKQWYIVEGKPVRSVADGIKVSKSTIYIWMKEYGIKVKNKPSGQKRNTGFFANMTNDELIKFIKLHHDGSSITYFQKSRDSQAYYVALERGLIDSLVQESILVRRRRRYGFFAKMSDVELIEFIKLNHSGSTLVDFQKSKNSTALNYARQRGLIDRLVGEGTLHRHSRASMTDEDLLRYVTEKYSGKSLSEFRKDDESMYNSLLNRGLIDRLVDNKILIRTMKKSGFFKAMTDDELINYIALNYNGWDISQMRKTKGSKTPYGEAVRRGLIKKLVLEGIINTEKRFGFFSTMTDEELVLFIKERHNGKSITGLQDDDSTAYKYAFNRNLIESLIKQGILIRRNRKYESNESFQLSLKQDPTLRDLSALAVSLNGNSNDVEQIINEIYKGRFSDLGHLHELVEENKDYISSLLRQGITNLGSYIGDFSLEDRPILPILLGNALASIPVDKITASLESRIIALLRNTYGPNFNANPEAVLQEVQVRVDGASNEKVKDLYSKLLQHYIEVVELSREL